LGSSSGPKPASPQTGRDQPEPVVAINRNPWSQSIGISGRNGPECAGKMILVIIVATARELRRKSHFQRLAIATAALEFSRRKLIDEVSDELYGFKGEFIWPDGEPFDLPDIDDAFGGDGSFRWISDFIRFAEVAPYQHPQRRIIERLRMIDLYFRIAHPERARLIAE
ncbi:MAG: hypothetical protein KJ587_02840, partial [Alphaproteobacteria bacterium]|nr:hypothetical protein [Alphaproteobacteria bacterium]